MNDVVAVTKEKVQRFLMDSFGGVNIDRDGDFHVRNDSAHVFIRVIGLNDQTAVVRFWAPMNRDVPESPELYKFLATENNSLIFGRFAANAEDGKVTVTLSNTLLGNFMDPGEFEMTLRAVAVVADEYDDKIKAQFGGTRFHE